MIVSVYKSRKKAQTYLYVPTKGDFSAVPAPLLATFGTPVYVMPLPLTPDRHLPAVDADKLLDAMQDPGFYLQLPPPEEDLLAIHKEQMRRQGEDSE